MSEPTRPFVIEKQSDPEGCCYFLEIPPNLIFFQGHFAGFPLLAGVVQINWVMTMAEYADTMGKFQGMSRVKFSRPILPGARLWLDVRRVPEAKKLIFRYFDELGDFSSGVIHFGS